MMAERSSSVLILPLPPLLLDFSLAISITFSVLILMTSLFIQAPLEFSAFPTVLLISTMLRLRSTSPRRA
jgi:flagellar biosynthesis protein FlhA